MLRKISTIFSKKTKAQRRKTPTKKRGHHFFDDNTNTLFKKRKKSFASKVNIKLPSSLQKQNKFIIFIAVVILFIISILFLLFSPFFKIDNIYIFRQDSIINIDQAYGNIDYIRSKNIFFLDTNEIAMRLQKSQKSISNIQFDIDFPNSINIHIGSYPALFQTQDHLILSNGVVVSKNSKEYLGTPFLHTSENIEDYAIFGNTLNIQDLKNLDTLIKQGTKNILGFNFQDAKYYIKEKELLLMHSSGTIFIFDLSLHIENQIEKLAVYEKERGNLYEKKYIYIDVRIPDKLFLCPLESEYDCKENITHIYGDSIFEEFSIESSEPQQ